MIWIAFAALTLAVLVLLAWPLLRPANAPVDRSAYDLTVYRDQLKEVDADLERGLLSAAQAEAARTEIKRRILTAADKAEGAGSTGRAARSIAAVVVVLVPLGALGLYSLLGRPGLPDQPFAERSDKDTAKQVADINAMVDGLAEKLKQQPNDIQGWSMLARSARMLERFDQAADAYRHLIALGQRDADTYAGLGEAALFASEGFTPEAVGAFQDALRVDAKDVRSRFYLGMSAAEQGDPRGAVAIWRDLERDATPDAEWLSSVQQRIAQVAQQGAFDPASVPPKAPVLSAAGPAPALPKAADNQAMIESMIDRLAARLKDNPGDGEGWKRLGRAYRVQEKLDQAKDAYAKATALLPDDLDVKLAYVDALLAMVPKDKRHVPAEAILVLQQVLAKDAANQDALYLLGLAEVEAGRVDGAKGYWVKLLATLPAGSPERAGLQKQIDGLGG
jgi:cytochrome c-type biogenesis protein CcmH